MKTQEEHRLNHNSCPLCGSQEVNYPADLDVELDVAFDEVNCGDCKASWRNVYRMIAFDQLKNAKGEVVSNENW